MHFYLHERENLCKDRQAVVTALHLCRRKVGKGSKFETDDGFSQISGQDEEDESGSQGEVVGEIEGLLGGEEKVR